MRRSLPRLRLGVIAARSLAVSVQVVSARMVSVLALAALLAVGLAMPTTASEPPPRLETVATQGAAPSWHLSALPEVLGDPSVKEHLGTGLTTTFLFRLTTRSSTGDRLTGGARVQVRYELWDEVYHVAAMGIDGRLERRALDSLASLEAWWRELSLLVLDGQRVELGGSTAIKLSLEVVPFSSSEQRDAQRWFSESLEKRGRSSAEEVAEAVEESPEQLGRAINLLLATSIQRRALATFRWTLPRPSGASP